MENIDLKILWIEDELDFLEIAKNIIVKTGYIPLIAQKIAEIKNVSIEEVAEITSENALEIFEN